MTASVMKLIAIQAARIASGQASIRGKRALNSETVSSSAPTVAPMVRSLRWSVSLPAAWMAALTRASLASRASTVKFHAVFLQPVSNHPLYAAVQTLLIGNGEIFQSPALQATNMVVPVAIGFVARRPVADLSL